MRFTSFDERRQIESLDRSQLGRLQLERFNRALAEILTHNKFYQQKLSGCPTRIESLDQLAELPLTTKEELQPAAGDAPFATNLTYPIDRYIRFHQTSGTRGRPLGTGGSSVGSTCSTPRESTPTIARCSHFLSAHSSAFGARSMRSSPAMCS
jgi:phenylacetate-coenzyme A ligase PaaK-like adenylate-forming protein